MPMFGVICKKVTFFEIIFEIDNLTLPRFVCRVNHDSESKFEATHRLVSMPQIQLRSQIWQTSFR